MVSGMRRAMAALAALAAAAFAPAHAEPGRAGAWAGVFAGAARWDSRIVDPDGFANWGHPGHSVDYGDSGALGGVLAGMRFAAPIPFRVELDAAFGRLSAATNRLDPAVGDETAVSELRWTAAARVGVERALGPATLFAAAGLAAARIETSVTDLDRDPETLEFRVDPDDSLHDRATRLGWTAGAGIEAPLDGPWTLRLEGGYMDFGRSRHMANRSGDNRCGRGGPRRPCPYVVDTALGFVRLALVRRLGP